MPGANREIQLVRLASDEGAFTILGRFPAGFERTTAGGYAVSEEFLVLDGELELENTQVGRGDLCVVPAGVVRTPMRSPAGCTVLAWFAGPAIFRPAAELVGAAIAPSVSPARQTSRALAPSSRFAAVQLPNTPTPEPVLSTDESTWHICPEAPTPPSDGAIDLVDVSLTTWLRWGVWATPAPLGPVLTRRPRMIGPLHR